MKVDWFLKFLLLVIAIFLGIIALRPYVAPRVVEAQSNSTYYPLYIDPRIVALSVSNGNSTDGRIVIDLRNGNIWGFPETPPSSVPGSISERPQSISHPMLLGKWVLTDMDK